MSRIPPSPARAGHRGSVPHTAIAEMHRYGRTARGVCVALLVLLVLGMSGCASLLQRTVAPRISLIGVELISAGVFEQRFRVQLRIQNPNDFALPITGLDYTLDLNGQRFASGVSHRPVTIPAYGEGQLVTTISTSLGSLFQQLQQQLGGGQAPGLRYRLKGRLRLEHHVFTLPFEYQGDIKLNLEQRGTHP